MPSHAGPGPTGAATGTDTTGSDISTSDISTSDILQARRTLSIFYTPAHPQQTITSNFPKKDTHPCRWGRGRATRIPLRRPWMSTGAPAKHVRREKHPSSSSIGTTRQTTPLTVNPGLSSIIRKSSRLDPQEPLAKHVHDIETIKAHELASFLRAFAMRIGAV